MNRYKKLAINSVVFAIGNLGSKLISLILIPLYTYYLTKKEYGTVDLVTTSLSLVLPIAVISIYDAVLRFVLDKSYDKKIILNNAIFITFCGNIIAWFLYPLFKLIFPFDNYLLFFYIMLLTSSINSSLMQYIRANEQIKLFAAMGIISSCVVLISNVLLLVVCQLGIIGYLLSLIFADLICINVISIFINLKKTISIKYIDVSILKQMLRYSIPLVPNTLMWWVMGVSDRYLITYFIGISANGLYAVANKIPNILSTLNAIFFQAWQMSAIEEADSKSKSVFFSKVFNVMSSLMFFGTSLILAFLKIIMKVIVSPTFFQSWKYVPFLLLGVVFSSFSAFLGTNYIAAKNTIGVFRTSIIGAIVNVLVNFILIPWIGVNGASISTMLSFLAIWLIRIFETRWFVKIEINKLKLITNIFIIGFQIIILYLNQGIEIVFQFILFLLILCINRKELYLLGGRFYRIIINKFVSRNGSNSK